MEDFLISLSDSPERAQFLRTSFACLKGAGAEASEAVVGLVTTPAIAAKAVWDALKDPKRFATHVQNQIAALMKVLASARAEIELATAVFKQLPQEEKSKIACDLIGGVGAHAITTALATIALGPAGATGLATATAKLSEITLKMKSFLAKYKKVQSLLARTSEKGALLSKLYTSKMPCALQEGQVKCWSWGASNLRNQTPASSAIPLQIGEWAN